MANKQYKNKQHLLWVKQRPCLVGGCNNHNVVAHHLLKPFDGYRGTGMKANDRNAIPLCNDHHVSLHTQHGSEKSFFTALGLDAQTGKFVAEALWNKSPYNEKQEKWESELDNLPF